jgi:plastocyanin
MYSARLAKAQRGVREDFELKIPRILFAVPVLVAGMLAPTAGAALSKAPSTALGMGHEGFARPVVTIHRGQTLTLVNDSHFVHTIGPGKDGTLGDIQGVPMTGRKMMESNARYTTGQWNLPGTYTMTCSVHPEMTVKVIVTN